MPFQFRVDFRVEYIDEDKFVTETQRNLRRLMRQAAAIYYNNLMLYLPTDTGFLAGSFKPIKDVSGAKGSPTLPRRPNAKDIYKDGGRSVRKTPASGVAFVTPLDKILNEVITDNKFLITFFFSNEIRYYPINDIYGVRGRPPWKYTVRAARQAIAFIEANLPSIIPNATARSVKQQLISYRPGRTAQKVRIG